MDKKFSWLVISTRICSWLSISQGNMDMASLQNNNKSLLVTKMVMVEKFSQKDTIFKLWREDNQSALGCFYAYTIFIWKNNFWYGQCFSNAEESWKPVRRLAEETKKPEQLQFC